MYAQCINVFKKYYLYYGFFFTSPRTLITCFWNEPLIELKEYSGDKSNTNRVYIFCNLLPTFN